MNQISQVQSVQRMSSREIADITGKQHQHVKRDIEIMFNQLQEDVSKIGRIYHDSMNRSQSEYLLDKDQTICLIAGYSPIFRMSIIKRWQELENKISVPQTFAQALQLAADQARQLELAAPKVNYYDKVVERATLLDATQVAQKIRMSAMAMNKYLDDLGVYSRGVKRARVFQQWFIEQGLGELKQTELGYSQPMFTTKGEAWVIERLTSEGVIAA